jgi:hypothetical protein
MSLKLGISVNELLVRHFKKEAKLKIEDLLKKEKEVRE